MTESTTPSTPNKAEPEKKNTATATVSSDKSATEKPSSKKQETSTPSINSSNKVSKIAIFAVLIAIAAPAGHYYWQQLQNQTLAQTLSSKLSEENNTALNRYQSQLQLALTKQQQMFDSQLQQVVAQTQAASESKITKLSAAVETLEQRIKLRQPSDWLLHEAEYLIRVAARTLWLEHDTRAAIGLLNDANARLTELNDPAFLPVQEVIYQDIKTLELLPQLHTEEVVLALMAMNKQVNQLTLSMVDLTQEDNDSSDLALSGDISDWQSNLAKTWQKFLNDFIRIRARTGSIEPLMSPAQQENLKQNLSLKIQLALWAASERKSELYQKALSDIQQWLNDYFDMTNSTNQRFADALVELSKKQISYDYPSELNALSEIRATLRRQSLSEQSSHQNKKPATPTTEKNGNDEIKTDTTTPDKAKHDATKSEGSI